MSAQRAVKEGTPAASVPRRAREMDSIFETSIGKKIAMALAGLVFFGYLVLHLIGNLKIFTGEQHFNEYSAFLRTVGAPVLGNSQLLWLIRLLLLAALVVHVGATIQLYLRSRAARRVRYAKYNPEVFSNASRTMLWGGIAILLFVIYHVLHLTTGDVHPQFVPHEAYRNLWNGFQSPLSSIIYVVGMIAVGLHLYHGLWSATQTFGLNNKNYNRMRRPIALVLALAITLGFLLVPIAVWTGMVDEPASAGTHVVETHE